MVNVHGRTQDFTFRASSLLQDTQRFYFGKTRQTGDGWSAIGPISDGFHRADPDRSALEPSLWLQVPLFIARSVALRTFGDFLDEIFAAFDVAIGGGRRCGTFGRPK